MVAPHGLFQLSNAELRLSKLLDPLVLKDRTQSECVF